MVLVCLGNAFAGMIRYEKKAEYERTLLRQTVDAVERDNSTAVGYAVKQYDVNQDGVIDRQEVQAIRDKLDRPSAVKKTKTQKTKRVVRPTPKQSTGVTTSRTSTQADQTASRTPTQTTKKSKSSWWGN